MIKLNQTMKFSICQHYQRERSEMWHWLCRNSGRCENHCFLIFVFIAQLRICFDDKWSIGGFDFPARMEVASLMKKVQVSLPSLSHLGGAIQRMQSRIR